VLNGFVKKGQWSAGTTTDEERQAVRALLMESLADPTAIIRTERRVARCMARYDRAACSSYTKRWRAPAGRCY
jgi:hypothetical protein